MTRTTRRLALFVVAVLLAAATWYLIAIGPGPAWTAVKNRLSIEPEADEPSGGSAPWERNVRPPRKPAPKTAPNAGQAGPAGPRERILVPAPEPSASAPAAAASNLPEGVVTVKELGRRQPQSMYLPGQRTGWTSSDVIADAPIRLRAGGLVSSGADRSGPDGLAGSIYERSRSQRPSSPEGNAKVVPSAPYLALLGRVCSGEVCSAPFLIGSGLVVCPAAVQLGGTLQVWTNNYARVDGSQTAMMFSRTTGGYWLYSEPAPAEACGARSVTVANEDARALASGGILRKPEFSISSSQTDWKPFFVPISEPLLIRASGEMQPENSTVATGPEGIVVPDTPFWVYPGTSSVIVDNDHKLVNSRFPYQALIGRLCDVKECGSPFLVGRARVVCPQAEYGDHLELWINHIVGPTGLLGASTPLTLDTLDLQARRGEYRFEIAAAPGGCVK